MKRLIKANELDDLRVRNNIKILKEEINRLNRELRIEKEDLESVVGKTPMGDLALNIIDQAKYIEKCCYKAAENLENNNEAQDYIYDLIEDTVEQARIINNVMDSKDPAGLLVDFINKVFQVNKKYLNQ